MIDARDWRDVANEIVVEFFEQRRVHRVSRERQEQRIAVGLRTCDRFDADMAARARTIFNDEGLAESIRQPLTDEACREIDRAASGNRDDNVHRLVRIALRPCDTGHG